MQVSASFFRPDFPPQPMTLHILSNFAVGKTVLSSYWQEQIAFLKQQAIPFQIQGLEPLPSFELAIDASTQLNMLREPKGTMVECWPTWCTFLTENRQISDSFLLISMMIDTGVRQHTNITLRFRHPKQLFLMEAIEQAEELSLCTSSARRAYSIPLDKSELSLHLEYIRSLFR